MGQTAVSRRLIGEVPMDLDELERFSSILDVPISHFLGFETGPRGQMSAYLTSEMSALGSAELVAA